MSYILDALRKAEQQREIGHVPGIDSLHEKAPRMASRRWLWVLVAILVLNTGLLSVLLWPDAESQAVPEPNLKPELRSQTAPLALRQEQRPKRESAPKVDAVVRSRTADAPEPPPKPVAHGAVPERAAEPSVAVEPPPPAKAVISEPVSKPAAEISVSAVPPPPVAQQPPQPRKARTPQLPTWPQIPNHLFQQLDGSLHLDVHVFSDQPENRFVLINLQKYHEGEQLQEGPLLDEITPEGVIMSFQGQRFRVRAQ